MKSTSTENFSINFLTQEITRKNNDILFYFNILFYFLMHYFFAASTIFL